jgi:hypothetical protein
MSYRIVRASEIGEYLYCRRAWWLHRVQGQPSYNVRRLTEGDSYHRSRQRSVIWAVWLQRAAISLIFVAVAVLAFWLVNAW